MGDEPLYHVTYTGNDVVTLGKSGLFQHGTSAFVGEADANAARAKGSFTVTGPVGGAKAQPAAPAKPAAAKPEEKKAEAKPEEKKADAKHDEKKPEAAKGEEKKPEPAAAGAAK